MALFGALKSGWVEIAGDFTPTLNTEDDPTSLKANESPACYGVDCEREGRLATGSCLSGTAFSLGTGTGSYTGWSWLYNRLWYVTSGTIYWGSPYYRDFHLPHEYGSLVADGTITGWAPVGGNDIVLLQAAGSQVIRGAASLNGVYQMSPMIQGYLLDTGGGGHTVLNEVSYVCNASGVFSYDGNKIVEMTRKIRGTLGTFANKTLRYVAAKRFIVLYSSTTPYAAIEVDTGKLFDYGTSGFLFTSRTLSNPPGYGPFSFDKLAVSIEHGNTSGGNIQWQSKSEDGAWTSERNIDCRYDMERFTRIEVPIENPVTNCHKFAVRLTGLSSNIYVRSIQVCVQGMAEEAFTK